MLGLARGGDACRPGRTPRSSGRSTASSSRASWCSALAVPVLPDVQVADRPPFTAEDAGESVFGNVHSLRVNDDVRENSRRIGRSVSSRSPATRHWITLEIDGRQPVYGTQHRPALGRLGAGDQFVEFNRGHHPGPGHSVTGSSRRSRTPDSSDLNQVLNIFDPLTRDASRRRWRQLGAGSSGTARTSGCAGHRAGPLKEPGHRVGRPASPKFDLPTSCAWRRAVVSCTGGRRRSPRSSAGRPDHAGTLGRRRQAAGRHARQGTGAP